MAGSDPEISTLVDCYKATAAAAGVCAGITLFYILKNQDLGLSIYKLLINGMALTYTLTAINLPTDENNDIDIDVIYTKTNTIQWYRCYYWYDFADYPLVVWGKVVYLVIVFSPLWDKLSIYNASLMVVLAIRVAVVIFVAIRLLYHFGETTPKPSLLFALNQIRLLFIFVSVVLQGTGSLDHNFYPVIPGTVIMIIILFLTSFKIECPQDSQNSGTANVAVVGYVPPSTVNTTVMGHVPATV
ncbi:7710_t:CDS:2 [Paraglomus brasilianum]|uniref:7710_t:CDS:1 n=1 Tax=Paraglomus brasilianum TaxID=144538 RepID=A0A9N9CNG2_9GLOM|nr:7710_t:CDS:2 [Paraglomus brasilianum]